VPRSAATVHFAKQDATDLSIWSIAKCRRCALRPDVRHPQLRQHRIALRDSSKRMHDKRCPSFWLRGRDLNPRPSGYEPDELPGCSTPRLGFVLWSARNGTQTQNQFHPVFLPKRRAKEDLPLIPPWARYTPRQSAGETIQSSSEVERSAVNSKSGFCPNFAHTFSRRLTRGSSSIWSFPIAPKCVPFSTASIRLHDGRPNSEAG
jgi:hypothetical protein